MPVGVIATAASIAQAINPAIFSSAPAYSLLGVVVITISGTYLVVRPRKSIKYRFPDARQEIVLEVGNVFNSPVAVITTDRKFSHDLTQIGDDSLMGQLVTRYPCVPSILSQDVAYPSPGTQVDPGTVVDMSLGTPPTRHRALLLACGQPGVDGTETTWSDLSHTFIGLWSGLRNRNLSEASVPVLGSGFSGTRLSHAALLQLLLFSYVSATKDRPVTPLLRVVVAQEDYDWDSWLRADRLLRGLGLMRA